MQFYARLKRRVFLQIYLITKMIQKKSIHLKIHLKKVKENFFQIITKKII